MCISSRKFLSLKIAQKIGNAFVCSSFYRNAQKYIYFRVFYMVILHFEVTMSKVTLTLIYIYLNRDLDIHAWLANSFVTWPSILK